MRKKHILKAFSLIATVCIAAGCNGSEIAETTTTTAKQTTIVSTTTKPLEEEINSTGNSEQPLFQKEFEITDWTMDELVSDMTICGKKIMIPCTISELSSVFNIEEFDRVSGATGKRSKGCEIYNDNIRIAFAYCDIEDHVNSITSICFDEIISDDMQIPEISIMGITDISSLKDVVTILGEPNVSTEYDCDYRYFFSNNQHLYISFDDDKTEIKYMAIVFKEE